jgi:hypothetical protein
MSILPAGRPRVLREGPPGPAFREKEHNIRVVGPDLQPTSPRAESSLAGKDFPAEFSRGTGRYDLFGVRPMETLGMPEDLLQEKRMGEDRRRKTTFPPTFSAHRRRRSSGRRQCDAARYVDIYDAGSWRVAISILLLSTLDGILTGMQIRSGFFREANPLMNAVLIHGGVHSFVSIKLAMTAMPLAIIILHKEWAVARFAARLCLWSYILLTFYHLYLILLLPS